MGRIDENTIECDVEDTIECPHCNATFDSEDLGIYGDHGNKYNVTCLCCGRMFGVECEDLSDPKYFYTSYRMNPEPDETAEKGEVNAVSNKCERPGDSNP